MIIINPKFFRPTEVNMLMGDSTKAREELGWTPKTAFEGLIKEMEEHQNKYKTYSNHCILWPGR